MREHFFEALRHGDDPVPSIRRFVFAWAVGEALCVYLAFFTHFELSGILVVQPVAALMNAVAVAFCLIAGMVFWLPWFGKFWRGSVYPAVVTGLAGVLLLACAFTFGASGFHSPEDEVIWEAGPTMIPGWLLLIFAILHFPRGVFGGKRGGK